MALKIRLKRTGKKKQASFRIVVVDGNAKRDSRSLEEIGHYFPHAEPAEINVDRESAISWLEKGAQPTPAARRLLTKLGVMQAWHEHRYSREPQQSAG